MGTLKRKGFLGDIISYLIALFLLAVVILVMGYVVTQVNAAWQASNSAQEAKDIVQDYKDSFIPTFDRVFAMLVIGYMIVVILLGYYLRSSPAFAYLAFLLLVIFGIVAVHLANAYYGLAISTGFADVSSSFSMMTLLTSKLPHIVVVLGITFITVLYSKSQNGDVAI